MASDVLLDSFIIKFFFSKHGILCSFPGNHLKALSRGFTEAAEVLKLDSIVNFPNLITEKCFQHQPAAQMWFYVLLFCYIVDAAAAAVVVFVTYLD